MGAANTQAYWAQHKEAPGHNSESRGFFYWAKLLRQAVSRPTEIILDEDQDLAVPFSWAEGGRAFAFQESTQLVSTGFVQPVGELVSNVAPQYHRVLQVLMRFGRHRNIKQNRFRVLGSFAAQ